MNRFALSSVLGILLAGTAYAGSKTPSSTYVTSTSGQGNVGDARASANTVEHIGCSTYGSAGAASGSTFCWAVDAKNNAVMCSSTDKTIVQAAAAITNFSYIMFQVDREGSCTFLNVLNQSNYTPIVP